MTRSPEVCGETARSAPSHRCRWLHDHAFDVGSLFGRESTIHDPRGRPLDHIDVDVGLKWPPGRHAAGRSGPIQNCQLSTRGEILPALRGFWWQAGSRTIVNWESGRGSPAWLAVNHREVDVGDRGGGNRRRGDLLKVPEDFDRTFRKCVGSLARGGISPATRLGNLSKILAVAPQSFERCIEQRTRIGSRFKNKASTTSSCASDAEHEFSRTRSPGRHPMRSFRDARGLQLLLMRTTLVGKGGGSDCESDSTCGALKEAFS
jgi:hypothetical protein